MPFPTSNSISKVYQLWPLIHVSFFWPHKRFSPDLSSRCLQGPRPNRLRLSSTNLLPTTHFLLVTIASSETKITAHLQTCASSLAQKSLISPCAPPSVDLSTTLTMPPPTGPRGGTSTTTRQTRSSTGASRPPARGGIAKRGRGPAPRVDRDGDLVMDPAAGNKSGAGINKNTSTRRGTTRSSGPKANTRLQQNLARQLGGDTSQVPNAPSAAKLAANNTTLKVLGVKSSKAATNPDGGEKRLLEFLERKASTLKGPSRRHVTIKKVCSRYPIDGYGGSRSVAYGHTRYFTLTVAA